MAWLCLLFAGLLEIVWAYTLKEADGFTRATPTIVTLIAMVGSFAFLSVAMKSIPLGTAYTIWTGIGAVGAFMVGIAFLGEAVSLIRVLAVGLIVAGIVLMKFGSSA